MVNVASTSVVDEPLFADWSGLPTLPYANVDTHGTRKCKLSIDPLIRKKYLSFDIAFTENKTLFGKFCSLSSNQST